jgi:hypothetical protein
MKKRSIVVGLAITAVVAGTWGLTLFGSRVDPEVQQLQQLRDSMFSKRDQLSSEDRRDAWHNIRERVEGLSDEQRQEFMAGGREQIMVYLQERMDTFFALPPEEQRRKIDERIAQIIEWRQNPGRGWSRGGEQGQDVARGANHQPGEGHRRGRTEAQRDERRKRRLDRFDPRLRAQFTEYRRLLNKRLEQTGHEPFHGRPWRSR